MAIKTTSAWCRVCDRQSAFNAPGPNHVLHLILSVVTLGLWIPVWIIIAISAGSPKNYRCATCGTSVTQATVGPDPLPGQMVDNPLRDR